MDTPIADSLDTAEPIRPKRQGVLKRWCMSAAVWYLYVPHLKLLRMMGPQAAVRVARLTAWAHWMLTFFGAQGKALRAIRRSLPELDTPLGARTILRKYLEGKHHHFVAWHLAAVPSGRKFVEETCREFVGKERFEQTRAESGGLIVLAYHFGTGRMLSLGLADRYGQDAYEIAFRPETYGRDALPWVAKLAYDTAVDTDARSGLNNIYMAPNSAPISVIRHLRKGHIVGMAGDGFFASQFVEVPFLGGTMRFPTGVARLAAMTGAPIVSMFGLLDGIEAHHVVAHEAVRCPNDSPEAIEETVRQCIAILEGYVRKYPWAWWIWHRLEFDQHPDGRPRLSASALAATAAAK